MQKGELIHMEKSYKYTVDEFRGIAMRNNLKVGNVWEDAKEYFSLFLLRGKSK